MAQVLCGNPLPKRTVVISCQISTPKRIGYRENIILCGRRNYFFCSEFATSGLMHIPIVGRPLACAISHVVFIHLLSPQASHLLEHDESSIHVFPVVFSYYDPTIGVCIPELLWCILSLRGIVVCRCFKRRSIVAFALRIHVRRTHELPPGPGL